MRAGRFVPFRARDGWRWHLLAGNNRVVADSGEAYTSKAGVLRAIAAVTALVERIGHKARIGRLQGKGDGVHARRAGN